MCLLFGVMKTDWNSMAPSQMAGRVKTGRESVGHAPFHL